jgi:hypothetical protein
MSTANENKSELQNTAPYLFTLNTKQKFNAPDSYFDRLPARINERILAENKPVTIFDFLKKYTFKPITAICSIVLFASGYLYLENQKQIADYTLTAMNAASLSDDDILSVLDTYDLQEVIEANASSPSNDDVAIDYLLDNHTDLNTIINAL